MTLENGWSDKGWFWGPLELEVPKPFVSNGTTLTFNLCTLCCRLRSLPLCDFKRKSCAKMCSAMLLKVSFPETSLHIFRFQVYWCGVSLVYWCGASLDVFHPQSIDPESVESMQRECRTWISKLKSLWLFFPSYLTLRHVHITWSPLTEEVIWSHGVLYSMCSSSIRGELRHQILHRLLRKSDLGLQPVPTPFRGWENRWN